MEIEAIYTDKVFKIIIIEKIHPCSPQRVVNYYATNSIIIIGLVFYKLFEVLEDK